MKITGITKKQGTRYTVDVDGDYWYILDLEIIASANLKEGMEVTESFLEELLRRAKFRKARERALYLLTVRDHSRKELVDKLIQSVEDPDIAEQIADKMEEYGYLDDEKYARKLARDCMLRKKQGERRARFELQKKGISRETVDLVMEELEQSEEYDPSAQLKELIGRKYARYLTDPRGIQKVTNALARLGHSYSDIRAALAEYQDEWNEGEDFFPEN